MNMRGETLHAGRKRETMNFLEVASTKATMLGLAKQTDYNIIEYTRSTAQKWEELILVARVS